MMGTDDETALLALLRNQRMLLFVGAGLSLELGYPYGTSISRCTKSQG